ncbi:MAG: carbon starvation CstA family protein [Terriglobales bacterium]
MYTFPILLGALSVHALAYRSYGAFIAAKALALDDRRTIPRHTSADASGHAFQGASS